ncbi:hypothetical protein GCM10027160_07850 [Streptomyces calidiresistens]
MEPLTPDDPRAIGDYRLIARLGEGGMGNVYLARSPRGRTVAVKTIRSILAGEPDFRRRFAQEITAARRVGDTWTAPVLDADPEADVPWVATGYIAGPSLHDVVTGRHGPLPERSVLILAHGLTRALGAIHGAGLIHRDLKPSNILLTIDGPRVIDFGIARVLESTAPGVTRTGSTVGSPGFMSPEQVRGETLTPASDVFCLGSVLAYAATGRTPFGSTDSGLHVLLFRVAEEEPDLDELPDGLRALVADCLAKDPAARPATEALAERLAPVAEASREPWLPGALIAQLGRHAVELLNSEDPMTGFAPVAGPAPAPSPPPASSPLPAGPTPPSGPGTPPPGNPFAPPGGTPPNALPAAPPPGGTPAPGHPAAGNPFAAPGTRPPGAAPHDPRLAAGYGYPGPAQPAGGYGYPQHAGGGFGPPLPPGGATGGTTAGTTGTDGKRRRVVLAAAMAGVVLAGAGVALGSWWVNRDSGTVPDSYLGAWQVEVREGDDRALDEYTGRDTGAEPGGFVGAVQFTLEQGAPGEVIGRSLLLSPDVLCAREVVLREADGNGLLIEQRAEWSVPDASCLDDDGGRERLRREADGSLVWVAGEAEYRMTRTGDAGAEVVPQELLGTWETDDDGFTETLVISRGAAGERVTDWRTEAADEDGGSVCRYANHLVHTTSTTGLLRLVLGPDEVLEGDSEDCPGFPSYEIVMDPDEPDEIEIVWSNAPDEPYTMDRAD